MKKIFVIVSIISIIVLMFITFKGLLCVSTYPIIKNIEKRRILKETREYKTLNTEHFFIKYNEEDENIAKITAKSLEKYYYNVCSKFNYFPEGRIPVIIYNEEDELKKVIKLKSDTIPQGAYYCGVINILTPYSWACDVENIEDFYKEKGPYIHEFTHFLVDEKTNGNYPLWLTEGIALYMEKVIIKLSWEAGIGQTYGISLEDLNDNFQFIKEEIAYRKSYEVVSNLVDNYGFDKINSLLDNLGKGNDIEKSIEVALKVNIKDIE